MESSIGGAFKVTRVITQLLGDMLPRDCVHLCNHHLYILLSKRHHVPGDGTTKGLYFVSEFHSRQDIIDAVVASAHMPYFNDGNYSVMYRGEEHVDGAWLSSRMGVLLCRESPAKYLVDYNDDDRLDRTRAFYQVADEGVHVERFMRGEEYAVRMFQDFRLPRVGKYLSAPVTVFDEPASRDVSREKLEEHPKEARRKGSAR